MQNNQPSGKFFVPARVRVVFLCMDVHDMLVRDFVLVIGVENKRFVVVNFCLLVHGKRKMDFTALLDL
mgnify:CR=1 FL=1